MLWVYGHYTLLILSVRGSTLDVRLWRLKSVPALKGLSYLETYSTYLSEITYREKPPPLYCNTLLKKNGLWMCSHACVIDYECKYLLHVLHFTLGNTKCFEFEMWNLVCVFSVVLKLVLFHFFCQISFLFGISTINWNRIPTISND